MKRLLVVDEDPHCAEVVSDHLRALGYEVVWAQDGIDAVAEIRRRRPDLVLLDLFLPRLDGFSVLRILRAQPDSPKVIVLSAAVTAGNAVDDLPLEARPDRLLGKPVPLAQLAQEIAALVGRPTHPPPPSPGPCSSFAELLVALRDRGETGRLMLRAEDVRTHIYLLNGIPVFAEHGTLGKSLGRLLLDEGRLAEEQYALAIRRMTEQVMQNEEKRLGEVLLELGFLRPLELFAALQRQVREKMLACFQWDAPEHTFEPGLRLLEDVAMLECQTVEPLLLEGIRRYYPDERIWAVLGPSRDRHVRLALPADEVVSGYGLSSDEVELLTSLDGTRTVADLCASAALGAEHAAQLLWALQVGGATVYGPPEPRAEPPRRDTRRPTVPPPPQSASSLPEPIVAEYLRVRGASPARVLELSGELSAARVEGAYKGALARIRSGMLERRAPATPAPDLHQRSGEIFGRLESARSHLLGAIKLARTSKGPGADDPLSRGAEKAARLTAEQAFRKGKRLLGARSIRSAVAELERAVTQAPDVLEYELHLAWARYLAAGDHAGAQTALAGARLCALRALKQDQGMAKAHAVLGHIFSAEGDRARAERHLRLAVEHDPGDLDAQAELRVLESRGPREAAARSPAARDPSDAEP